MEEFEDHDRDIAYSRTVKAGKRIYYLDVKRNRNDDLYISLTESKKKITGNPENPDISFEKHKIFLYREDLSKFTEALIDVIRFIKDNESAVESITNETHVSSDKSVEKVIIQEDFSKIVEDDGPIKLNMGDFE